MDIIKSVLSELHRKITKSNISELDRVKNRRSGWEEDHTSYEVQVTVCTFNPSKYDKTDDLMSIPCKPIGTPKEKVFYDRTNAVEVMKWLESIGAYPMSANSKSEENAFEKSIRYADFNKGRIYDIVIDRDSGEYIYTEIADLYY